MEMEDGVRARALNLRHIYRCHRFDVRLARRQINAYLGSCFVEFCHAGSSNHRKGKVMKHGGLRIFCGMVDPKR